MQVGINLGAEKGAVTEARKGILEILKSGQDQATMQKALDVFGELCAVKGCSVSSCSVSMNEITKKKKK